MLKFLNVVSSSIEIIRMSCDKLWSDWLQNKARLIYTEREYTDQKRDIHFHKCFEQSRYYVSVICDGSQIIQICSDWYMIYE